MTHGKCFGQLKGKCSSIEKGHFKVNTYKHVTQTQIHTLTRQINKMQTKCIKQRKQ
uniref:Uncharacterized protein n=1 Tax=Anguilla anguilla TaxID=7936 RepID=A0A0E9WY46_ANGAN